MDVKVEGDPEIHSENPDFSGTNPDAGGDRPEPNDLTQQGTEGDGNGTPSAPDAHKPQGQEEKSKGAPENDLYARAKRAEDVVKEYKRRFGDLPKSQQDVPTAGDRQTSNDPIEQAKAIKALADYDEAELDHLKVISKGLGVSPVEAAKDESFKTFVEAHRAQVAKGKAVPAPSDGGGSMNLDKTPEEIGKMSDAEFKRWELQHKRQSGTQGI